MGAVLFEIFGAAVLALAIWATLDSPGPVPAMDAASSVLHALFYFWAAGSLMVYMLADRTVTTDGNERRSRS